MCVSMCFKLHVSDLNFILLTVKLFNLVGFPQVKGKKSWVVNIP